MNPFIRFNHNPESSTPYTISLDVHLTFIFYVWLNMIDFSILITIRYAIEDLALVIASIKQHRKFMRVLKANINERKSNINSLEILGPIQRMTVSILC